MAMASRQDIQYITVKGWLDIHHSKKYSELSTAQYIVVKGWSGLFIIRENT